MADWDDKTIGAIESSELTTGSARDRAYLIVLAGTNVGEMYKVTGESMVIGRGQQAEVFVVDEGISRRHARLVIDGGAVFVEDLGSTNGTYLNGRKISQSEELRDGDKIQIGSNTILKFTYHDRLEEDFQRQMYESALRDGLTKIFNKKYFLDRLESEYAYSKRHATALSLVMVDIDFFKRINDEHGHLAGDFVLVELARMVGAKIRSEDVFARYGGEEFAVICRGIDLGASHAFADRIRKAIAAYAFVFDGKTISVTISAGIAALPSDSIPNPTGLIAAADEALYQAKREGRNRVVIRR